MTGIQIRGEMADRYDEILTQDALELIADLHRQFSGQRESLLGERVRRQAEIDSTGSLDFLAEIKDIREAAWTVAPPAPGLVDRRVEITGPTDAKMAINALNSGAKVWMADFEDANTPLWSNMISGQLNLADALDGTLTFTSPEGKHYELGAELATIMVRPRGWHLVEKHILVDGAPVSASIVDFALYLVHCGQRQIDRGAGPYYYLPKLESHREARLWNDVFCWAQDKLGIPRGTIRATVLIETITAAFEMEEILYELRDHSAGLNAGRWDYLFSIIKKFRNHPGGFTLPDRNTVTMAAPFMRAYTELLVRTCHHRGAHAIGGMAAFIPSRRDPAVNEVALAKVRQDKEREAAAGFDGSWVAHPDLVPLCAEVFDSVLKGQSNQLERTRGEVKVESAELLDLASGLGKPSLDGVRNNVSVGLRYIAAWLGGSGAVAIFNLMEDAATAEIARSQLWQWYRNDIILTNGEQVTQQLIEQVIDEEFERLAAEYDDDTVVRQARNLFTEVSLADEFVEFLTVPAYDLLP